MRISCCNELIFPSARVGRVRRNVCLSSSIHISTKEVALNTVCRSVYGDDPVYGRIRQYIFQGLVDDRGLRIWSGREEVEVFREMVVLCSWAAESGLRVTWLARES